MMSLGTIDRINREVAAKAAQKNLTPYVPFNVEEVDNWSKFPFPNFGEDYVPEGWELTDTTWFVDASGLGDDDEPALTAEQFKFVLRGYIFTYPEHGFAIIGEGHFQVHIGAFRKK